jgi:hypothetical protein
MSCTEGYPALLGLDAARWMTRRSRRTVLVIVHTVTSGQRLLDVIRVFSADLRVQVVFTKGPDVFGNGVTELLRRIGGYVVPWRDAIRHRFDLAVAAAYGGIEEIHAPLIVLPHGAGYNKRVGRRLRGGARAARGVYGLAAQELVRDGMVVPSAIVLAHREELRRLGRSCPEAVPVAEVVGDPCHDLIKSSIASRAVYRRALGVEDDQELVVVTSTWGPRSLFARRAHLLHRLLTELPRDRYNVAALLHPNVWFGHGVWQIRAWLAESVRNGLALIPPEAEWRGALVAADHVLGDSGSLAVYATVSGASVLLTDGPGHEVDAESAGGVLARIAPRLRAGRPLAAQLRKAALGHYRERHAAVVERLTSAPDRFHANIRRLMYRHLRLSQPPSIPRAEPVPPPHVANPFPPSEL